MLDQGDRDRSIVATGRRFRCRVDVTAMDQSAPMKTDSFRCGRRTNGDRWRSVINASKVRNFVRGALGFRPGPGNRRSMSLAARSGPEQARERIAGPGPRLCPRWSRPHRTSACSGVHLRLKFLTCLFGPHQRLTVPASHPHARQIQAWHRSTNDAPRVRCDA